MKFFGKIIFSFILMLVFGELHSQGYNWITPNKIYLKMYIAADGMIRINKADFNNAGINTSVIDPRTVKVYNNGNQIPLFFKGEQDGVFNDNDYFDFYGKRNYGGVVNTYDQNNNVSYTTNEYFNQYSDTNIYWAGWDGSFGIRYDSINFSAPENFPEEYYYDKIHFEKDVLYSLGENVSSGDFRFLSNEKFKGEGWYWKLLYNNQFVNDTISLPFMYQVPRDVSFKLFAYPLNYSPEIFNEHRIQISVNGVLVSTILSNDMNRVDTTVVFSSSVLSSVSLNNIEVKYVSEPGFSGAMYFDFFEMNYPRLFNFANNKFSMNLNSADTASSKFRISGYNSLNQVNIFDVKNNLRLINYSSSSDTLRFSAKRNSQIEIVNDVITNKPFRIKQKSVPDFISGTNGADYLILYHSIFSSQAEQLRAYRETHDNYRSVKSEIEDIYDVFNFGNEDPIAVKKYIRFAYDNWQSPKVKYVCLFGRGSLDPKQNSSSSVFYKNYIPVYGNPNTDGYFAHLNTGGFYYSNNISIGRLPAYYVTEAQAMVDKIISYESQPPAAWWKTFTFITGGGTYSEQQLHQGKSNYEINNFVTSTKISGKAVKIYRTDTSGSLTYNIADSVKNVFNRGTLFVNFRGHAGSHDWEIIMNDPNTLNNGSKLPLILSLTCFTGENSKADFRGFGERMIYLNNKGGIGFVGTTGWSFGTQGNDFGTYILQNLQRDSVRRIGDYLKEAGFRMKDDSGSFNVRHTINCYNLIGDPAANLKLPKFPEFVITQNDYKISNEAPVQNEPVMLTIYPKNFGLYADSCKIRFQLRKNNQDYSFKDTVYKAFRFMDTVKYNFSLDSSGSYDLVVTLDIDNRYPLEDNANNSITINLPSKNNTFLPLKPVDNSIIYKDSVEFSGLNPNFSYSTNSVKVILKFDTSKSFSSPLLRTFINENIKSTVTKFKSSLPVLSNNTIYYWTATSIINGDTTGWSRIQNFIYNSGITGINPQLRFINSFQNVSISKFSPNQYNETDFYNTGFVNNEIKINEVNTKLFVRSLGNNAEEASYFSVGNNNVYIDAGLNAGLNLLKVSRLTGKIIKFKNVKVNNSASSDTIVSFLNTFDTTHFLMLLNAAYDQSTSVLTSSAKSKLRQFGSIYCDSIHLVGYFHTWSFIGFLGADHSEVNEMFDPCCRTTPTCTACDHWAPSISTMDVIFKEPFGTVSYTIGPASSWTDFSWTQTLVPGGSISFDVFGIDVNNAETLLFPGFQTHDFSDISKIIASEYPRIKLLAKLEIDTLTGFISPSLNSLKVNYSPSPELILDANSFVISASDQKNPSVNFSFDFHNAGFSYIYGTIINVYNINGSDSLLLLTDTVGSTLNIDSTFNYSGILNIPSFRDSTRISVNIQVKDGNKEFHYYNNFVEFTLKSGNSNYSPVVEIFGDGRKLTSGDNISINPEIKILYTGNFQDRLLSDTSLIRLNLNNVYIPYFNRGLGNSKISGFRNEGKTNSGNTEIIFYPEFNSGKNKLSVIYITGEDYYDTLKLELIVSEDLLVTELYNYPNPLKTETNFIFNVSGSLNPGKTKIKIYTVSGRLIRTLDYPVLTGINQIPWDGKDSDGDFAANGTYLYKLVFEDSDLPETPVQKLVILK